MKISEEATEILTGPAEVITDMNSIIFESVPFIVTEKHITLLRKLRFGWETAETGAPMVDQKAPYGTPDALAAVGDVTGAKSDADQARQHVETYFTLIKMLREGSLAPGDYPLRNIKAQDIRDMMQGYFEDKSPANDTALGLTADGKFRLTGDHLKLIKTTMLEWPDSDAASELLGNGLWPSPAMDPKRPYGDMSYFQADLSHILDLQVEKKDGEKVLSEEQEKAMLLLHWQMLGALQVFVENADFRPGTYK